MTGSAQPIGVFDSGVGGLTVVRALREALPAVDIVYLGDTARVPYGSKSARTVDRYAQSCLQFLLQHDVQLVLVACNTVSATSVPSLTMACSVPVIGAVEPGAKAALRASRNQHIGIIGTLATQRSGAYKVALTRQSRTAMVTTIACPLLVPLAEEGWTDDAVTAIVARRYLQQLLEKDPDIDVIVLGCTHYPLLAEVLGRVVSELTDRPIALVDSASSMAAEAVFVIAEGAEPPRPRTNRPGSLRCYVTDATRLQELSVRFLGASCPVEVVDL